MNVMYLVNQLPDWLTRALSKKLVAENDGWQITQFFLSLLLLWLAGKIAKVWLNKLATKVGDKEAVRAVLLRAIGKALPLFGIWGGLRLGLVFVRLGPAEGIALTSLEVLFTVAVALLVYYLVDVPDRWLRTQTGKTETKFDDMLVPIVRKSLRVTVALFAVVSIAQILSDKPVSALVAGLGLGGLAFALAAQDTIKNLFGSLVIFTDKPFALGDRITYDGHDGTVEEVGLRSTRLRRSDGHVVTVPNGGLANNTIHNISERPFIRRNFTIGVTYDTSPEKVRQAKEILEDALKDHEGLDPEGERLPRVHFSDFSASSLDFKCIYWYHPPAYWDYMAFSERLNLEILTRFNEAGIEFAFPSQTIYLAGDGESVPARGSEG
jgi:MscS family membrane protein